MGWRHLLEDIQRSFLAVREEFFVWRGERLLRWRWCFFRGVERYFLGDCLAGRGKPDGGGGHFWWLQGIS